MQGFGASAGIQKPGPPERLLKAKPLLPVNVQEKTIISIYLTCAVL